MKFGIYEIFNLIGALGFFIFGMKVMSDGIQKAAGDNMRKILSIMTTNRFAGVFTGFLITSLIQSSSATTVMLVSFVNAGLLSLQQSIGVIMGANIGTTMTAVLITFFGFSKFSISYYSLPMIGIGFPMMMSGKSRLRSWGEFIIGFSLLFMGLDALKSAVPELSTEALSRLQALTDMGFLSILLFVLIGTLITVIVQSSSAAMAITLVMCENGWIPFEIAAAIVLGENIGTTITANIAAIIANKNAKRAARAHTIFNVFGVIWILMVFPFFLNGIANYLATTPIGSPFEDYHAIKWGLTIFHISFNVINTAIMIWFIPTIIRVVEKLVPQTMEDEEFKLEYIDKSVFSSHELALVEAKKGVIQLGNIIKKMNDRIYKLIDREQAGKQKKQIGKIYQLEILTDEQEREISDFMLKLSQASLSQRSSTLVRSIYSIIHDLERQADLYSKIAKEYDRKIDYVLDFTEDQLAGIRKIHSKVSEGINLMLFNMDKWNHEVDLESAKQIEKEINQIRTELKTKHFENLEKKRYQYQSGLIYYNIFIYLERVGDHIINVSEASASDVT
jgi:phosphate:Na+ symporter